MDRSTSFIILVEKFLTDSITSAEERDFLAGLESEGNREILRRMIDALAEDRSYTDKEDVSMREAGFEKLEAAIQAYETERTAIGADIAPVIPMGPGERGRRRSNSTRIVSLAAAALLLLGTTLLLVHNKRAAVPVAQMISRPASVAPLAPGGNKALLQLGNGSTIALDSAPNGLLASQGGARIVKLDSGELSYQGGMTGAQGSTQTGAPAAAGPTIYNTISTPRGGQYQLVLPDGTRVWLNAASSLRFPTAFTGRDRTVSMTGEVYFEVAPNKARPFRVQVNEITVDVLGTHFNVMAYGDEKAVKTTLLEGSVKVVAGDQERLLVPGQEASLSKPDNPGAARPGEERISVQTTDVEQAIAWKNGFFEFENMDLGTIMRQISRWYDVDISYETEDTAARFGGDISRKLDLPDVLRLLEVNGVHFRLDNRTLTVIP